MNLTNRITFLGAAIAVALTATVSVADVPATADGNRYYSLPRYYKSEISVSEAYLAMEHSKDYKHVHKQPKPVLIDVRSLREYASGHPEGAYNVPYPTVSGLSLPGEQPQDPVTFYWDVYDIVNGNVDTPIMTLCRTGHRSILGGNILARPDLYGISGPDFTNVRNIWEGFVGQPKYAFDTGTDHIHLFKLKTDGSATTYKLENGKLVDPETGVPVTADFDGPVQLDLNNDGVINSDTADVYTQTKDANPDKDGWRNFAGLPWTTHIQEPLAYERAPSLYDALNLTPVQ
jgi:rhodanese-related sulfurtransferase